MVHPHPLPDARTSPRPAPGSLQDNLAYGRGGSGWGLIAATSIEITPGPTNADAYRRFACSFLFSGETMRFNYAATNRESIEMKNFLHAGPPFVFSASFKRTLHRHHDGPPLLGFWIGRHFRHVCRIIRAVIFEVTEEQAVLQEDGIIANVTFLDHCQHFRPHRGMVFLIFVQCFRP